MIKYNFHTHTTFCDGKSTAEEMVRAAIEKGFTHLGFSGHVYTSYDESCCMLDMQSYREEISRLKEIYDGKIKIYCGIELDALTGKPDGYEYYIGSAHYIDSTGICYPVDHSKGRLEEAIIAYGGDIKKVYKEYYSNVVKVIKEHKPSFVGHIDLITKFNEDGSMFDETSKDYRETVMDTIDEILKYCNVLEMNTGAISRGYKTLPYPAKWILKELAGKDCRILISADAHSADAIDCGFEDAYELAVECGLKNKIIIL